MSATPEPVALAREVLALAHEDETVTVCTIPDNTVAALARAVVRVLALADRLDREAFEVFGRPLPSRAGRLIRAALEGESHE